ncbi:transposase [Pseudomonas putida]|uniref:transposase n=1 Tax=Pseudomonas putida TaxID=303 RepID=UPI003D984009
MDTISGPSSGYLLHPQLLTYSKSFKAQVVQKCSEPDASTVNIALRHSLNSYLIHKWIRLHNQKTTALQPAFIELHPQMLDARSHPVPTSICLEIQYPRTPVKMTWPVDSAATCASFLRELLR